MTKIKSYCINLASRTDRWYQVLAEFNRIGITVEHFPAIPHENPMISFNRSQYACLKAGLDSGAEIIAIYEDDCIFDGEWAKVEEAISELPYGWEALYLGCNITTDGFKKPERIGPNLCRLKDAWQSHSIIYSRKGADYILSQFKPDGEGWSIYDEWMRNNMMPHGNVYLLTPMIASQRPSFSDIWQTQADYSGCHITGNRTLLTIR